MQEYFQPGEDNQELRRDRRRQFFDDLYDTVRSQIFSHCSEAELDLDTGERVTVVLPMKYLISQYVSLQREQTFVLVTMNLEVIEPERMKGLCMQCPLQYVPPAINDDGTYVLTPKDNRSTNAS